MDRKSISTRTSTSRTTSSSNPTRSKSYRARAGCLLAGFILLVALIIGFTLFLHLESVPDPTGPPDLTGAGSTVQDNTLWGEDAERHQSSVDFNEFPLPSEEAVLGDPPPLPPLPLHRLYYHPQTGNFWYIDDEGIPRLVQFNMTITLRGDRISDY